MFKLAKIERLPKMNFRYHLLKVDGEWYLMEVDQWLSFTYFLPWFVYFIPHKTYQLTEDEVETIAPKVFERDKKRQSLVNNKIGRDIPWSRCNLHAIGKGVSNRKNISILPLSLA